MTGVRVWVGGVVLGVLGVGVSHGQIVITEIMYNPASTEGGGKPREGQTEPGVTKAEWVEIANTSDAEVDLTGWVLKDGSGSCTPLAEGSVLAAGAAAVIVPDTITAEDFTAAWGEGITVFTAGLWEKGGMRNLANNPKQGEAVELLDKDGNSVDVVTYFTKGDWPRGRNGHSIYLVPEALDATANDTPAHWRSSEAGYAGARTVTITDVFDGADIGSPGTLPKPGDALAPDKPVKPKKKPAEETPAEDPPVEDKPAADDPGMGG